MCVYEDMTTSKEQRHRSGRCVFVCICICVNTQFFSHSSNPSHTHTHIPPHTYTQEFAALDESALVLSYRNAYPNESLRKQWVGNEPERLAQEKQDKLELQMKLGHNMVSEGFSTQRRSMNQESDSAAWKRGIIEASEGEFVCFMPHTH